MALQSNQVIREACDIDAPALRDQEYVRVDRRMLCDIGQLLILVANAWRAVIVGG